MFVYVAGAYTSDPEGNTQIAIKVSHALMDMGHTPFCPHLCHYMHLQRSRDYEEWLRYDFLWLAKCDVLVRFKGNSPGGDREEAFAAKLGIPILFLDQEEKVSWESLKISLQRLTESLKATAGGITTTRSQTISELQRCGTPTCTAGGCRPV